MISLNGDSHSQPFQITNTGTTHLQNIGISLASGGESVFDVSSHLANGSTTDAMNGTVTYSAPAYPRGCADCISLLQRGLPLPDTSYYDGFTLRFDGPGLSPGASATVFADVDVILPEPRSASMFATGVVFLILLRAGSLAVKQRRTRRATA
jgi:hypothetical protein